MSQLALLVRFLTSRALSWPNRFPVRRFTSLSSHSSDVLHQTPVPLACHDTSAQLIVIAGLSQDYEAESMKAKAIALGESVLSSLTWYLIMTLRLKKNETSTQSTVEQKLPGHCKGDCTITQNMRHNGDKI